eukprot:4382381-Pleurochrysis_carterae.AAC.1
MRQQALAFLRITISACRAVGYQRRSTEVLSRKAAWMASTERARTMCYRVEHLEEVGLVALGQLDGETGVDEADPRVLRPVATRARARRSDRVVSAQQRDDVRTETR